MTNSETWYIVKQPSGHCEILSGEQISHEDLPSPGTSGMDDKESSQAQWGPFASQGEAIARRVGLIRAGKCQPL
ncbi:MAG TPA: hypothetical protein V6C57_12400 [Coleofasciculaceae cyanobacterium]